jgi:hypothetical protein
MEVRAAPRQEVSRRGHTTDIVVALEWWQVHNQKQHGYIRAKGKVQSPRVR